MTQKEFFEQLTHMARQWIATKNPGTRCSFIRRYTAGEQCPITALGNKLAQRRKFNVSQAFKAGEYIGLKHSFIQQVVEAADLKLSELNKKERSLRHKLLKILKVKT